MAVYRPETWAIEVKPSPPPSMGEVLRQINGYKAVKPEWRYAFVCPSAKWASVLLEHDIEFWQWDDAESPWCPLAENSQIMKVRNSIYEAESDVETPP